MRRLKDEDVRRQFETKFVLEEADVNEVCEKARDGFLKTASEARGWKKGPPGHVQTCRRNEDTGRKVSERKFKFKFKAWWKAKGTVEEEAVLEE